MSKEPTALSTKADKALSAVLDKAEQEGAVVGDLFPQLNSKLREEGPGSMVVGEILDYKKDAAPSALNPDNSADVMTIRDISDGQRYNFFASNGGTKAKFRHLVKGSWALVLYGGAHKSETKGHNDWHDYRNVKFANRAQAESTAAEILETLAANKN